MGTLTKMSHVNGEQKMPHAGKLLEKVLEEKGVSKAELARRLDIHPIGITHYIKQHTLHAALLWKIGLAINHNFLADLSAAFPIETLSNKEAQLQQQLADLEKKLAVYQEVLKISGK
jgi:plasmid maintenance system antidote protein VapI